ncbi:unnamed protein product [Protopolystoma xenopodis]|uniref:Uncharacterized protein n=1 Tax=Protopolystoma xenopodis TaxID=117903 RepID=A0A3S5CKE9_9PLAT|nr:unnamed protein product [Protopolystoma xenopodis]
MLSGQNEQTITIRLQPSPPRGSSKGRRRFWVHLKSPTGAVLGAYRTASIIVRSLLLDQVIYILFFSHLYGNIMARQEPHQ